MIITLYHRTTKEQADVILHEGFRDVPPPALLDGRPNPPPEVTGREQSPLADPDSHEARCWGEQRVEATRIVCTCGWMMALRGVALRDRPYGVRGTLLAVDIPAHLVEPHETHEIEAIDGREIAAEPYREFLVPADVLNRHKHGGVRVTEDEDPAAAAEVAAAVAAEIKQREPRRRGRRDHFATARNALRRLFEEDARLPNIGTMLDPSQVDPRIAVAFFRLSAAADGYLSGLETDRRADLRRVAAGALDALRPYVGPGRDYELSPVEERSLQVLYETNPKALFHRKGHGGGEEALLRQTNEFMSSSRELLAKAGLPPLYRNRFTPEDLRTLDRLAKQRARANPTPSDRAKTLLAMALQTPARPDPVSNTTIEKVLAKRTGPKPEPSQ